MSKIAALLTRMSMRPAAATTCSTMASIEARRVTSRVTAIASRPSASAVSAASGPRISAMTTRAPSPAKRSAMAAPIPRAPPVTMATLLSSFMPAFLPAGIAAVCQHDRSGQQARRVGGEEENDGADLLDRAHAAHGRAVDPVFEHLRIFHAEAVQGRVDIGRRHGIDPHAARAPFGGKRAGQVMHGRLGGIVVALRLRPVDDEAGHRADI